MLVTIQEHGMLNITTPFKCKNRNTYSWRCRCQETNPPPLPGEQSTPHGIVNLMFLQPGYIGRRESILADRVNKILQTLGDRETK